MISACGLVLGLDDGVYVDGGLDGFIPTDSASDAAADSREPLKDVIDIETNFATCDGSPPIVPGAIYVAVNGTDSATCGTVGDPCKTIGAALALAKTSKTIYVGPGSYDEQVLLGATEDGYTLQGGFDTFPDAAWVPNCSQQAATIQSTKTNYSVKVEGSTATLRLLKVISQGQAPDEQSVFAVVVNNGNVTLDNTLLLAENAGRGTDGTTGGQGIGCNANGGTTTGTPGAPGSFGTVDFMVAQAGQGGQGTAGVSNPGDPGECSFGCGMCVYQSFLLADGGPPEAGVDGSTLDGGGAPEGGTCMFGFGQYLCAEDGGVGCGGSGGLGGTGGTGGGASVALFIAGQSKVTLVNGVSLNTANGGNGGNGGAGGAGAPGQTGIQGLDTTCFTGCLGDGGCGFKTLLGGDGGTGTMGGSGGVGGGGAGGPTYLYVSPNLSFVDGTLAPNWQTNSKLGTAGFGGKPNGDAGEAKPSRKTP